MNFHQLEADMFVMGVKLHAQGIDLLPHDEDMSPDPDGLFIKKEGRYVVVSKSMTPADVGQRYRYIHPSPEAGLVACARRMICRAYGLVYINGNYFYASSLEVAAK